MIQVNFQHYVLKMEIVPQTDIELWWDTGIGPHDGHRPGIWVSPHYTTAVD